jgi:hypothetical protein
MCCVDNYSIFLFLLFVASKKLPACFVGGQLFVQMSEIMIMCDFGLFTVKLVLDAFCISGDWAAAGVNTESCTTLKHVRTDTWDPNDMHNGISLNK